MLSDREDNSYAIQVQLLIGLMQCCKAELVIVVWAVDRQLCCSACATQFWSVQYLWCNRLANEGALWSLEPEEAVACCEKGHVSDVNARLSQYWNFCAMLVL